jgi:thiosulfate reductase / polysulfide reductase chain A
MGGTLYERPKKTPREPNVKQATCTICHEFCGFLFTVDEEKNKIVKMRPDPDHPNKPCVKGLRALDYLYHKDRIQYPMKRVGARGEGKWARISWEEAIDTVATELMKVKNKYGGLSIAISRGSRHKRVNIVPTAMMAYMLGSPNVLSIAHSCRRPGLIGQTFTHGEILTDDCCPDWPNSELIVIWAANPDQAHPSKWHDFEDAKKRGVKVLCVDPRYTGSAANADLWLRVKPGTDCALALGMINILIQEGLYDKEFVQKWGIGFDQLREHVKEYTLDKVSRITTVPAEKIAQAAHMYATIKPASLHYRIGLDQNINSTQSARAVGMLISLTGNIDVKGGNVMRRRPKGFFTMTEYLGSQGFRPPEELELKRIGADDFPFFCGPKAPWPEAHPPEGLRAMLTNRPYPVRAMYAAGSQILLAEPNTRHTVEAIKSLDFYCIVETFLTPTAQMADIVLPAAWWPEREEVVENTYVNFIYCHEKVVEPLGECRDDRDIIGEFFKKWDYKMPWYNVRQYNEEVLRPLNLTWDQFVQERILWYPLEPYKRYENLQHGFRTSSGKVEYYSQFFKRYGYDPIPVYRPTREDHEQTPDIAKEYPYLLISGGRNKYRAHADCLQIPALRKLNPYPIVQIHPDTAKAHGIEEDDWVWIATRFGKIRQRAQLMPQHDPKLIHCDHCYYFPEREEPEQGCFESNVNMLMDPGGPYDPMCGSVPFRGMLCKIWKAEKAPFEDEPGKFNDDVKRFFGGVEAE